jgi:predicted acetyltransferase
VKPPNANPLRRDANPSHVAAYRKSIGRAQEEYFDRAYGTNQLSLAQLATHPDYFGRGAATMLLQWGVVLGQKERWPITVFAGPMAYNLYRRFGFKTLVKVTTQVLDEEENIEFPGMAWEPIDSMAKDKRRPVSATHQLLVVYDSHRTGDSA